MSLEVKLIVKKGSGHPYYSDIIPYHNFIPTSIHLIDYITNHINSSFHSIPKSNAKKSPFNISRNIANEQIFDIFVSEKHDATFVACVGFIWLIASNILLAFVLICSFLRSLQTRPTTLEKKKYNYLILTIYLSIFT